MSSDEDKYFNIPTDRRVDELRLILEKKYPNILTINFEKKENYKKFWFISKNKEEPRLADRFEEEGSDLEQPLAIARDIKELYQKLLVSKNNARSYAKRRWQGNTAFERREYQGNIDANKYKMEPWFVRKQASAEGETANFNDQSFATGSYDKTTANEHNANRISRPSDAETNVRRRVFQQPDIIDWKEQQGLGVKDTNRMLGR